MGLWLRGTINLKGVNCSSKGGSKYSWILRRLNLHPEDSSGKPLQEVACEVGPACWVGGKVAGRRVSQVWVTARAQEQSDGSPQLLRGKGPVGL